MAAAATALANRHIVANILFHLSDMKYKGRRQRGPDEPVELLEFRPTLVPSILVNKVWADEGISLLWKRYPHLPALKNMDAERRQYCADKMERVFTIGVPPGDPDGATYLCGLQWPRLKALELEVDFGKVPGEGYDGMLGPGIEQLEISGPQSGGAKFFTATLLLWLFGPDRCRNITSLRLGPGLFDEYEPAHASDLIEWLDQLPQLRAVELKGTGFLGTDTLFTYLSHRPGLEALEIDLEPGLNLLPALESNDTHLVTSLKRLNIMYYPEIALALPAKLTQVEDLTFDICRLADRPAQESDTVIIESLITRLSACPHLISLKIGIGALALDFPSATALPTLSGHSLVLLSQYCPRLTSINIFAAAPSAIDASDITSTAFDLFCKSLAGLKTLILKLHPATASELSETALQSLGQHCPVLDVLRLRIPSALAKLPVRSELPESANDAPEPRIRKPSIDSGKDFDELAEDMGSLRMQEEVPPLFPRLTHLALARPNTLLSPSNNINEPDTSSQAQNLSSPSSAIDPESEEDLVRTYSRALLTHFPSLEILEAWSDHIGHDNDSLMYFLPREEILASTWEFLSGVEQDLWQDSFSELCDGAISGTRGYEEAEFEGEGESWNTLDGSSDDWEAAARLNEGFVEEFLDEVMDAGVGAEELAVLENEGVGIVGYLEEEEGMITPGRTLDVSDGFFGVGDIKVSTSPLLPEVLPDGLRG